MTSNTSQKKEVRVRFAPSPTGMLHIGGARTAIDNWAFARSAGGKFILRIEDTDPKRSTEENTQIILRALKWLNLDWDEGPEVEGPYGPYFQTHRLDTYTNALNKLIEKGAAYPCFCTKEELDKKRKLAQETEGGYSGYDKTCRNIPKEEWQKRIAAGEPHVWRLKVPENHKPIEFDDAVYGHMTFPADVMDDLVIMRAGNIPTYNFAVVCDDSNMEITHVVRGDDHLSNTPRQILIYEALEREIPTFAHLSMILGPDKKKLSKRHGSTSVEEYKEKGYLPDALVNYLALLGWSLDDKTTIIPPDVLCKVFSLDRVNRKDCVFDEKKLDWMNGWYIRDMGPKKLAQISKDWFAKSVVFAKSQIHDGNKIIPSIPKNESRTDGFVYREKNLNNARKDVEEHFEIFERACPLIIERLNRLDEIVEKLAFLFWEDKLTLDEKSCKKVLQKNGSRAKEALLACREILADENNAWECDTLQTLCQKLCEKLDIKPRALFQPLRVAVCGDMVSPPLFESIELMKRSDVLARIDFALEQAIN